MKIAVLSRYERLGASSRIRMMQFFPQLAESGLTVELMPFFDDDYLHQLYANRRSSKSQMLAYYLNRKRQLSASLDADVLWVEQEFFPWLPWAMEKLLLPRDIPIVSEFDDAVFHRYDMHGNPVVRALLAEKIDRLMARSTIVVAGNDYLAERARQSGARRVEIVPSVVDGAAYGVQKRAAGDDRVRIGWIGTPSTWGAFVMPLEPLLRRVTEGSGALVRAVGAPRADASDIIEVFDWSEEQEVAMIQSMDIGIMPLDDSPWSRGKCGYKLIQYMACGVPVIASPVGVNAEIVEHGVNGFLASSEAEWEAALKVLLEDASLRERMGREGRKKVDRWYSLQVQAPRVADILKQAAEAGSQ